MFEQVKSAINKIRNTKPLILCLTNYVSMDFVANGLLALGAAPLVSCDERELEELVNLSHAISLNIGTLDQMFLNRADIAITLARKINKPIVLDPVGAGASTLRTSTARKLVSQVDIVRGNASEVLALLNDAIVSLGVESLNTTEQAIETANYIASQSNCTIVVSGEKDYVTDGINQSLLAFGSPLMALITGMGCLLTAVIAAFRAVIPDSFTAAQLATIYFGLCGELAASKTNKPGSFRDIFLNELYNGDFIVLKKFYDAA